MNRWVKFFVLSVLGIAIGIGSWNVRTTVFASAPSFGDNVAEKLREGVDGSDEKMYDLHIEKTADLKTNIRNLFHPTEGQNGGQLRDIIRKILYGVIVLAIFYVGFLMFRDAEEAKISEWSKQLMYVFLGAAFALGGIRVIDVLEIGQGSSALVSTAEHGLLFPALKFLKAAAFFAAIIILIRNGYQMMNATDNEEKLTKGKNGILVVIVALIFIKGIDYIYYLAQAPDLRSQATTLIINIAKGLTYILGVTFVLFMLYAGYRLITDGGKGEGFNQFKKIAVGILLGALVMFFFLLIMYQVILEFA